MKIYIVLTLNEVLMRELFYSLLQFNIYVLDSLYELNFRKSNQR